MSDGITDARRLSEAGGDRCEAEGHTWVLMTNKTLRCYYCGKVPDEDGDEA